MRPQNRRTELWTVAVRDLIANSVITPYAYYLSIPWNEGLLFAVPFAYLVYLALENLGEIAAPAPIGPAAAAVIAMSGVPSHAWDILMLQARVP